MNHKELLHELYNERNNLGQRIMVLSHSLYFDDDMPAKDLIREQRQAMDNYFEALDARITDLEYDISILDCLGKDTNKDKPEPNLSDLEGREIINTNPPHCHECRNDGSGCVKIILPGNQHICVK